jgi:hypothetical protein
VNVEFGAHLAGLDGARVDGLSGRTDLVGSCGVAVAVVRQEKEGPAREEAAVRVALGARGELGVADQTAVAVVAGPAGVC